MTIHTSKLNIKTWRKRKLILTFNQPDEFRKFAEKTDPTRFNLYYIRKTEYWMLRPSKSSKNLDTAIYTGEDNKLLNEFLEKKFDKLTAYEIAFHKE